TLPSVPDVFYIEEKEYSLAVVSELDKEADKLLKKATPASYEDKKAWDAIFDKKQEAVKVRTTLEKKRKDVVKPITDFTSTLKSKTDTIGNAAKAVQDKLDAALTLKENWEAEQARIEAERIAKRTEQRKEELRALGGLYDVESGTFT